MKFYKKVYSATSCYIPNCKYMFVSYERNGCSGKCLSKGKIFQVLINDTCLLVKVLIF